jgi:type VI secretion system protein VasG
VFKPAFLGRVTMVPYFPLSEDIIRQIVLLQLKRIQKRLAENYRARFTWDDTIVEAIASRCKESSSGARSVEKILSHTMLPALSALILERLAEGGTITAAHVGLDSDGGFRYGLD